VLTLKRHACKVYLMNTMTVAVTGTVHTTSTEIPARDSQVRASTTCSKRMVTGYIEAPGNAEVNCPKCLAH